MGFIDNKAQTINNVAILEVMGNLPKGRVTSSLNSVTSKNKNLLPFLLDLLSTTCKDQTNKDRGKCEATRILTDILVQFYPALIRILKDGIIEGIKAGLACGSDFKIPNPAPSITVKVSSVDFTDLLKIDPNTTVGSLYYNDGPTKDFNWFLYDLIQNGGTSSWKSIVNVTYDQPNQQFIMSVNNNYVGKSFNQFLIDYINSIDLISLESMLPKITNLLTGAMGANIPNINMSVDKLLAMEKVNSLQSKINSSDPCKEEYTYDDSFFTFTNDEIYEMENISNQKKMGVTYLDLGCGVLPVTSSIDTIKKVYDDVKNSTPTKISVTIKQSIDSINDDLTANVPEKDKKVAKLSLNLKMMEELPKVFTNVILEPKIVSLYQLSLKTVNDIVLNVTDGFDYAKATKVFFEYVTRESLAALLEIIFKQVKKEIISLVEEIAIKIAKEQAKIRIKAITSIVSGYADGLLTSIPVPNTSKYT